MENQTNINESTSNLKITWHGDLLNRKEYADFLLNYIRSLKGNPSEGLVIAIDAPWGYGKSFFVNKWAEDLAENHIVIKYDAWKNDINQDALISFISSISDSLEEQRKNLPKIAALEEQFDRSLKSFYRTFRKAINPTVKTALHIAVKKLTGEGVEEIAEIFQKSDSPSSEDNTSKEVTNAVLDKYFQEAISSQSASREAIDRFREDFQETLKIIKDANGLQLPTFVFIDEIDRCRPDYAIKLLESVKHIFNIPDTIFVFSTNIEQLSNSVCSIYGEKFDGSMYLKRFFNFEFELPLPSTRQIIESHACIAYLKSRKTISGLDNKLNGGKDQSLSKAIEVVSSGIGLDLRSIDRCLNMLHAAATGIRPESPILVLWLFFLCAIRHQSPNLFKKIISNNINAEGFTNAIQEILVSNPKIEYAKTLEHHQQRIESTNLRRVLSQIHNSIHESIENAVARVHNGTTRFPDYPDSLQRQLVKNWESELDPNKPHPVCSYPDLVRLAGHIS